MHVLTHKIKRAIAVVDSLHVGSALALCPPQYTSRYDFRVVTKDDQRQIWESYKEFCSVCTRHKVDTVFVLGETIDGINLKEPGVWRILTCLNDQYEAAQHVLRLLVSPETKSKKIRRKLLGVSGSRYHSSQDTDLDGLLIKSLGGQHVHKVATINIVGTTRVINIRHKTSGRTAASLERLINKYLIAIAQERVPPIDMLLAGHGHTYYHLHLKGIHGMLIPGWKAFDDFSVSNYPDTVPHIGAAIVFIDDKNRIDAHHYLYPVPHISDKEAMI